MSQGAKGDPVTAARINLRWEPVLRRGAELTERFTQRQGAPPTLRQIHYALFGFTTEGVTYSNRHYCTLSKKTAALRRQGLFPRLADNTRSIAEYRNWAGVGDHLDYAANVHRRDRTAGQEVNIYLGVEKRGMTAQLQAWFGRDLGIPILPLGGTSSEGFEAEVIDHIADDGRPSVLVYAGDWDASGEMILANFTRWVQFSKVVQVALTVHQVFAHDLPLVESKPDPESQNTHWPQFRNRYRSELAEMGWDGNDRQPVQVELDALDPDVIHTLYADAIAEFWDTSTHRDVLRQEEADRAVLRTVAAEVGQ